jgi:citrate lyase gamma subunit
MDNNVQVQVASNNKLDLVFESEVESNFKSQQNDSVKSVAMTNEIGGSNEGKQLQ